VVQERMGHNTDRSKAAEERERQMDIRGEEATTLPIQTAKTKAGIAAEMERHADEHMVICAMR